MLLVIILSCSKKNDADPQNTPDSGTASIKLTQNGKVITEFETTKVTALGGDSYVLIINSMDEKHSLTLNIIGQSAGKYPFISPTEDLSKGKANFFYQSYALPEVFSGTVGVLVPDTGSADVNTATKTRRTGSFTGTGKNAKDGKTYILEGKFDVPVFN